MTAKMQWSYKKNGNFSDGKLIGRDIAEEFLRFMGSGDVNIRNTVLSDILNEWEVTRETQTKNDKGHFLDGQKIGFLDKVSEFLTVAAFTLNCGLSEDNDFNPANISEPHDDRTTHS